MFYFKNIVTKISSLFCLSIALHLLIVNFGHQAIAEETNGKAKTVNSDFGLPTHRRDGGSRGNWNHCVANPENQNLMALIPDDAIASNSTTNPKLFFYVPKTSSQKTLEFVLRDAQDELIYEAFFSTEGDGILSVEVPDRVSSNLLATEGNYHWYLSLICDRHQRSRDLVVEGWLRQESMNPVAQEQINRVGTVQQAEAYHQQGFWYSALSVLAEDPDLFAQQPLLRQKWTEMLGSVGLEELAAEPFVDKELIEASFNAK